MFDHKEIMEKNAIDFLFYTYFEREKEEFASGKKIIEIAIEKAYQDATLQGAYNTFLPKPKDEKDTKAINLRRRSDAAYHEAVEILKKGVMELLAKDKDFDKTHKKICVGDHDKNDIMGLVDIYKKYNIVKKDEKTLCFTPGNAQKWVNMTMKYLYVICGMLMVCGCNRRVEDFCEKVFNRAQYFHIPIDSYILKAWEGIPSEGSSYIKTSSGSIKVKYICEQNGSMTEDSKNIELTTRKRNTKKIKVKASVWSALEDYKIYQAIRENTDIDEKVHERKSEWPIEWESRIWIENAKKKEEVKG